MMDATLYTHTCVDGFGSAIVFSKALKLEYPDIVYTSYAGIPKIVDIIVSGPRKDVVVLSDIHADSMRMEKLDKWAKEKNVRLLLYDHHSSASGYANEYGWVNVNVDISASMMMLSSLATDVLHSYWEPDKKLIETVMKVDAWDMWRLHDRYRSGGESLARYVDLMGVQQAVVDYLTNNDFMFDDRLSRLLGYVEVREVGRAVAGMRMFNVNKDGKNSLVGVLYAESTRFGFGVVTDTAFDLFPHTDYIIIVKAIDGLVTIRAVKHNVLDLVLPIGGGGNPQSAGFVLNRPVTISQQWEEDLVNSIFVGSEVSFYGFPD